MTILRGVLFLLVGVLLVSLSVSELNGVGDLEESLPPYMILLRLCFVFGDGVLTYEGLAGGEGKVGVVPKRFLAAARLPGVISDGSRYASLGGCFLPWSFGLWDCDAASFILMASILLCKGTSMLAFFRRKYTWAQCGPS